MAARDDILNEEHQPEFKKACVLSILSLWWFWTANAQPGFAVDQAFSPHSAREPLTLTLMA
jgi:hypothetical protein